MGVQEVVRRQGRAVRGRAELAGVRLRGLRGVVEPLADFGGRESFRRQFGDPVGAGDLGLAGGGNLMINMP